MSVEPHTLGNVANASPAQPTALARIKFHGLDIWTGDPFADGAMATLDAPLPSYVTINLATVRKLINEGWIGNVVAYDAKLRRSTIWILTPDGNELLNRHKQYLEPASREADQIQMRAVMRETFVAQKPKRDAALREWADGVEWTRNGLEGAGFRGFIPFNSLPRAQVPHGAGVYAVLRLARTSPTFREVSIAGHFKDRSPSVSTADLEKKWVPDVPVLYIGRAGAKIGGTRGLAKRLDEYRRLGSGEPVAHWGGR